MGLGFVVGHVLRFDWNMGWGLVDSDPFLFLRVTISAYQQNYQHNGKRWLTCKITLRGIESTFYFALLGDRHSSLA